MPPPVRSAESRRSFESAFRQFHGRRDVPGVFLAWSGIVESIIYGAEGLKPLDRWFSLLDGLMSEFGISRPRGRRAVTCSMVRALALRRPLYSAMERWADPPWSCPGKAGTSHPDRGPHSPRFLPLRRGELRNWRFFSTRWGR